MNEAPSGRPVDAAALMAFPWFNAAEGSGESDDTAPEGLGLSPVAAKDSEVANSQAATGICSDVRRDEALVVTVAMTTASHKESEAKAAAIELEPSYWTLVAAGWLERWGGDMGRL